MPNIDFAPVNQALQQGVHSLGTLKQLQETQRHNQALEMRGSEMLKMEREQMDIQKKTQGMAQAKFDREEAEYRRGQTPIDAPYHMTKLGLSQNAQKLLLERATAEGIVEETAGRKTVRLKDIQPFMQSVQKDDKFVYELEKVGLADMDVQLAEMQEGAKKGKMKDEEMQAMQELEKKRTGQLAHLDALEYKLGIKKTKVGPFNIPAGGALVDESGNVIHDQPNKPAAERGLTGAQFEALPDEDPRRIQYMKAKREKWQAQVVTRLQTMSPKNRILSKMMTGSPLDEAEIATLSEINKDSIVQTLAAVNSLKNDLSFMSKTPEEQQEMIFNRVEQIGKTKGALEKTPKGGSAKTTDATTKAKDFWIKIVKQKYGKDVPQELLDIGWSRISQPQEFKPGK